MSAAEDRFVLTEAGERALLQVQARRSAVQAWLRALALDGVSEAGEVAMALSTAHELSEGGRRWLEQMTMNGDAIHREWARWALERISE